MKFHISSRRYEQCSWQGLQNENFTTLAAGAQLPLLGRHGVPCLFHLQGCNRGS